MKNRIILISLALLLIFSSYEFNVLAEEKEKITLDSSVEEFIKGTYFEHANEFPDLNENVEVLKSRVIEEELSKVN